MKNMFLFWVAFFVYSNLFPQNPLFKNPLSERIANYDISVELNTEEHLLRGNEILHWKNTSNDIIDELQFHLYLNAFKNDSSTFMKESGGRHRGFTRKEKKWGWTDIISMKVVDGDDLTKLIEFYQPDDSNKSDQTVIRVPLVKPLLPKEEIRIEIEFISKLPNIFARTGYSSDYYLVGQWFPKIGVYERAGQRNAEKGGWNCHQFHANSEFYADFGVYNVELIVPKDYVVGATGQLEYEKINEDGTKYLLYHAEDVIDFVWTASPDFLIAEDSWNHVKIKVLVQPEHFYFVNRFLESAIASLKYLDKHLGKYPYPYLTIVDPPFHGMGSAGMEYPTLITSMSLWGFPEGIKMMEETTVHEVVHNYFMGLIASNEFEESWLDEGFTTYFESRIMDDTYGKKKSNFDLFGYHVGNFERSRISYVGMRDPTVSDNSPFAWEYPMGSYGVLSYHKTATWLTTLERIIGREIMDEIFKTYFERWKFKHPGGKDFIIIVNEVVAIHYGNKFGENMNWFFDQVLYGSGICDYKIYSIKNTIHNENKIQQEKDEESNSKYEQKKMYKSEVIVYRNGEVKLPVEVLVKFEDGSEVLETWDGQSKIHKLKYKNSQKIVWAKLDPKFKIALDVNLQNNSYIIKTETSVINKYSAKVLFWIENVMLTFGILF
jgi:Peptidase family M1 domain